MGNKKKKKVAKPRNPYAVAAWNMGHKVIPDKKKYNRAKERRKKEEE